MVGPSSGRRPMCPIRPVSSLPWTWQCSRTAAAVPRFCFRPVPVHPKSPWTRTAAWRTFQCHFAKQKQNMDTFLMFLYVVLYVKDKQAFLYTGNVSVTIESF